MQTSDILLENSKEHLSTIQGIRIDALKDDIEHRLSEFDSLLSNNIVTDFFSNNLIDEGEDFSTYDEYFSKFLLTNNFYNVYIMGTEKESILYSFKNEKGSYKSSGLSRVWSDAIGSTEIVMEDFDKFNPSMAMQSAFLGKSFRDDDGTILGVVVLQITEDFINTILKSREGLGDTGESYIISYDPSEPDRYTFRSNMKTMGNGKYEIGYTWTHAPLNYWIDAFSSGITGDFGEYVDSEGKKVLAIYNKIDVPWLEWYLITKVDKYEVLSSLNSVLLRTILVSFFILIIIAILSIYFSAKLTDPIIKGAEFAKDISHGNYNSNLDVHRSDEIGVLARALKDMGRKLKEQSWLRLGKEGLDDALRGEHDVRSMGTKFISFMVKHLDAQLGALYLVDESNDKQLILSSSYAFSDRKGNFNKITIGEGLVGQAAFEKNEIVYTHVPTDSPEFNYGVSSMIPTCYIATPIVYEDELLGVSLIGVTVPVTTLQRKFISNIRDSIGILINSAKSSTVIQDLLLDAQIKQEELRVSNEELEQQTEALKESEKDLQAQQEELRVTNEELEERTDALEKQRKIMKDKNKELEIIGRDLESKAQDLERASQYKSEFLANMSHELRTPLNSILILSQLISNNKQGNLDEKQIKSAKAINSSGEDLLRLINEILDLSKVESGKVDINPELMTLESLKEDMDRVYNPTAEQKQISFNINIDKNLPQTIITDPHRLQQVLKNLLTNAFKFTESNGTVSLNMNKDGDNIVFSVTDNGIGIPEDKQDAVFEAFKQADGSTSRKYGGTGLGLSISKELAKLLGGDITLKSQEGKGSTFSITLPIKEGCSSPVIVDEKKNTLVEIHIKDDREGVNLDTKTLLIIEDDVNFAAILKEQAHDRGFKVLIAEDGETGLHFADYYRPCGIILDLGLPGIDGLSVMERLKNDPELRHIPVHIMSGNEEKIPALQMGAIGFMLKPVTIDGIGDAFKKIEDTISAKLHKLLIIEDDDIQRDSIKELISGSDVEITGVGSGEEAYTILKNQKFDCVVLDLGLQDMSGYELLDRINRDREISQTPIIIYTGRDLSPEEELRLKRYAESIIIKGVKSPERLLEESSLFLHRVNSDLPEEQKEIMNKNSRREEVLTGKNILIVDDDMRNIFALSNILEDKDINVIVARDGLESIDKINENPTIDLVLMDIMMPKMDGYEAINRIRKIRNRETLPIIALTANAMKGDRNKCIDAGANDYLAKPVDNGKLLSMLRVWLY
ncbi:response regulator [Thiospirochaeta perfilievii]|uniref:histidine kinase n=1 Tax=Thiospirochaeta perfilievii TaxID=252967 RepID=A0A5C1QBN3_9SPIO|nr:response regulator [Thiospirochaeta perfilievii]QEN04927.1 response regulator [Thiospirochaeta perfilievii]